MWKLIKFFIGLVGLIFFVFQPILSIETDDGTNLVKGCLVVGFAIMVEIVYTLCYLRWLYRMTIRKPRKRLYFQLLCLILPNVLVQLYDHSMWTFVYVLFNIIILNLYYWYYMFDEEKRIRMRVRRVFSKFINIIDPELKNIITLYLSEIKSDKAQGVVYPRVKIYKFTKKTFKFVYYNKDYTDMKVYYVYNTIENFNLYYRKFRLRYYPEYRCYCYDLEYYNLLDSNNGRPITLSKWNLGTMLSNETNSAYIPYQSPLDFVSALINDINGCVEGKLKKYMISSLSDNYDTIVIDTKYNIKSRIDYSKKDNYNNIRGLFGSVKSALVKCNYDLSLFDFTWFEKAYINTKLKQYIYCVPITIDYFGELSSQMEETILKNIEKQIKNFNPTLLHP